MNYQENEDFRLDALEQPIVLGNRYGYMSGRENDESVVGIVTKFAGPHRVTLTVESRTKFFRGAKAQWQDSPPHRSVAVFNG